MGYRSNVAIAMLKEDYQNMKQQAEKIKDSQLKEQVLDLLASDKYVQIYQDDTHTVLHYEWIKWYNEGIEKDITWIEDHLPTPNAFIRIGEDEDDMKVQYNIRSKDGKEHNEFYDILSVRRDIDIDL